MSENVLCQGCGRRLKSDTDTIKNYDDFANCLCIFHRGKDDWYRIVQGTDGVEERDWQGSREEVARFWERIREEIMNDASRDEYDFKFFVFPPVKLAAVSGFGLREMTFRKPVNFFNAKFLGEANFSKVNFLGEANFLEASFSGEASFRSACFSGEASFSRATFSGKADFQSIRLEKDSRLLISGAARNLDLSDIVNRSGVLQLANLVVTGELTIRWASLGRAEFNKVSLRECKVTIENSHIAGCLFNGVDWGRWRGMESRFSADRDAFRQLKFANEQQGNIIAANMFYALEMREYEKELWQEKGRGQDKFVFLINKWVSNFSQSWLRALGVYCVVVLSLLLLETFFNYGHLAFQQVVIDGPKLWSFLNPLTDPRVIHGEYGVSWTSFFWSLSRLVSAFVIYQFIMAVRNQTRRR